MPRDALTSQEIDDEELARLIMEALAWDSRIRYPHIRVTVDDGIVYLAGTVERLVEKVAAEEDVSRIAGVTQVISNILVRPERSVSDAEIAKSVTDALRRDARVSDGRFEVESNSGTVTLRGEVLATVQKRAAVDITRLTYGVEGVVDRLTVLPEQANSDHTVEELISAALAQSAGVDEKRIHARVVDGVARLEGTADFLYQSHRAQETVEDVPGVRGVVNEIKVTLSSGG